MGKIQITPDMAKQIAEALNETDKIAKDAIQVEVRNYEKTLLTVSRLVDMYLEEKITKDAYDLKMKEIETQQTESAIAD